MNHIGTENIAKHETSLRDYANSKLCELDFLNIQGKAPDKGAIFSFTLNGAGHPHDISTIIDQRGIAVRAGHHCAQPLMDAFNLVSTTRASVGAYSSNQDFDKLAASLAKVKKIFETNTHDALDVGVFGAPTYVVGEQLFWGQDRLEFLERALKNA